MFKVARVEIWKQPATSLTEFAPQLSVLTEFRNNDSSLRSPPVTATSTADLSVIDDFCERCHDAITDCKDRSLLETWEGPHPQWFCLPATSDAALDTPQSLSDLFKWIAKEPVLRSLPRHPLVELAGNVDEGIMQFYLTPWLTPTNLDQNLRYINSTDSSNTGIRLEGPYFMTQLESTDVKGRTSSNTTGTLPIEHEATLYNYRDVTAANSTEARNKLLFNFGVLLLGLGTDGRGTS
ncbi:hypothetical protein NW768_012157 [Fusarium equiseti]|uniref:Uncharacterized protein n=1 Tax=Fusarium equiseti TaxID=61235 RepID=A0ABQ8QVN1_FUSEQ|nr:hypothetical protein NW768_012157 [Fusarium equiseti]